MINTFQNIYGLRKNTEQIGDFVSLEGADLQIGIIPFSSTGGKFTVHSLEMQNPAKIDLKTSRSGYNYGQIENERYTNTKNISVDISIYGDTKEEYEQLVDYLNAEISRKNIFLFLNYNGKIRAFSVIWINRETAHNKRENWNINYSEATLQFVVLDSYGFDILKESKDINIESKDYTFSLNNFGNAETSCNIIFRADSSTACTDFTLQNTSTGEKMKVTTPIETGDIFILNGSSLRIFKNSQEIYYAGVLPTRLIDGENIYNISFTGTDFVGTMAVNFFKNYL